MMTVLYLDNDLREQLLNYDIEHSDTNDYDNLMYYIQQSEMDILYDIISVIDDEELVKMGFEEKDLNVLYSGKWEIQFTNKKNYYIKIN